MVLEEPGIVETSPLRLRERSLPDPGPGELLLRVRCCGVCHTDLHLVEGDLGTEHLPRIPGHQIVGTVEAAAAGTGRYRRGQRVGVAWLNSTCGACGFCQTGRENLCREARFTGLHTDGGYAEYLIVREDSAVALPDTHSDVSAAPLLCAGIIGYRALRMSGIGPGERLGLYGFGASAHIAIQIARHWSCRVFVFTRSSEHRRLASRMGAEWVGRAEETPPTGLDAAVVFAPAGEIVPEALRVLDRGGTLALAGIYMTPIPSIPYERIYGERSVVSVSNSTRRDQEELIELASAVPIRVETATFALEDANRALRAVKDSQISGAAVLEIA